MPNPVSIITWRDAKSDPPPPLVPSTRYLGMWKGVVAVGAADDENEWAVDGSDVDRPDLWAELPVLSDLTDEDVRLAADELRLRAGDNVFDGVRGAESLYQASDRLRAALGGEKEGT